jgi:hypothetical protein
LPILVLVYLLLIVTWPLSLLACLLTGVLETAFTFRDRKAKTAPPDKLPPHRKD